MVGRTNEWVANPLGPKANKLLTVVFTMFIITDTIQVHSITNEIKYKHRVLFTEDDNHRAIFTMDDLITKCITNKD